MIKVGHVAAKLPCDSKSETSLKVLIGQAPNLKPANLELVKELSKPGTMCIYHVDVESTKQVNGTITDIALQNPTNKEVKFGPTATIVIGVDEIMPGQTGESMGNMSMGNSTGLNNLWDVLTYSMSLFISKYIIFWLQYLVRKLKINLICDLYFIKFLIFSSSDHCLGHDGNR